MTLCVEAQAVAESEDFMHLLKLVDCDSLSKAAENKDGNLDHLFSRSGMVRHAPIKNGHSMQVSGCGDSPMDGMDSIELRAKLGDRTYEAGVKLLEKGAVIERMELSGTAGYARVRDSGVKVVLFRDRDGVFDATCDCTKRPMGCKHCAAVYMDHIGFRRDTDAATIRGHIDRFGRTSFDPYDYDLDPAAATTQFHNHMQDKVLDRRIKSIGRTILEAVRDEGEREALFMELWDACGNFESPHDEWSRETIESLFGVSFWDDECRDGMPVS